MSAPSGTYAYTTNQTVQYGPGCTSTALPKLLQRFGAKKALIVCGTSLATKTNVIKSITDILGSAHAGTFTDIGQHAPIEGIERGLRQYTDSGADCIVSVGGGSPIDATKAMSHYSNERHGRFITHIAIPTTLSAAEFTPMSGFTRDGKKTGVAGPNLPPTAIILDAEHSLETPMKLWITTGLRALDHAVESLYRPFVPPFIRTLAYSSIADLFEYLPKCQADAENIGYRQSLQLAAWHSLFPYRQEDEAKSALGLSHALGYMLGAPYAIAHGQCSCITLGPVVRYKSTHATDVEKERVAHILTVLGRPRSGDVTKDVAQVGDLIDSLVADLGYGQGMLELGVPSKAELVKICEGAGLKDADRDAMMALLQPKL
ncbi:protein of unknown function [Taphrina deformans PYCC 5710]|uniref:Uncharacterized protein n=1 Tax=Taphrina deformans (strain PYCC 5710 / ATCC 11124 / CBS 356.35 / IMI 108563 / JCM 9778 / NBRC 8474) TaxID=1097556 RepID=R4XE56_TAPDE|nr:protein of unknown function [Taphrina deformans PYCC 5710]|eukprot:CCG84132.1 protein of unknown function [Taphrina deformans PYCC 5710]